MSVQRIGGQRPCRLYSKTTFKSTPHRPPWHEGVNMQQYEGYVTGEGELRVKVGEKQLTLREFLKRKKILNGRRTTVREPVMSGDSRTPSLAK